MSKPIKVGSGYIDVMPRLNAKAMKSLESSLNRNFARIGGNSGRAYGKAVSTAVGNRLRTDFKKIGSDVGKILAENIAEAVSGRSFQAMVNRQMPLIGANAGRSFTAAFTKSAEAQLQKSFGGIRRVLIEESRATGQKAGAAFARELNKSIKEQKLKVFVSTTEGVASVRDAVKTMKKDLTEVSRHAATVSERTKKSLTETFNKLRGETRLVAEAAKQAQQAANVEVKNTRRLVQAYEEAMVAPWRSSTRIMREISTISRETARVSADANRALKNSSAILREVYGHLAETSSQARLTMRDLFGLGNVTNAQLKQMAESTQRFSYRMQGFGWDWATYVTAPIAASLSVVAAWGLQVGAELDRAQMALTRVVATTEGMSKATKIVTEQLADLRDFAESTAYEFPALANGVQRLTAAGLEAEEATRWIKALGDAAAAFGVGGEEMNRAVIALSQSLAIGKIHAQEMNQFANAGIPIWHLMAEATGKSEAELRDLGKEGKLISSEILPALIEEMEKFEGISHDLAESVPLYAWQNALEVFRNSLGDLIRGTNQDMEVINPERPAMWVALFNEVERAFRNLLPFIGNALDAIVPALTKMLDGFNNFLERINESEGAQGFVASIAGIAAVAGPVMIAIGMIGRAIASVISALRLLPESVKNLDETIEKMMRLDEVMAKTGETSEGLSERKRTLRERLKAAADYMGGSAVRGWEKGTAAADKLGNTIRDKLGSAWDHVTDGVTKAFDATRTGLEKADKAIEQTVTSIKKRVSDSVKSVKESVEATVGLYQMAGGGVRGLTMATGGPVSRLLYSLDYRRRERGETSAMDMRLVPGLAALTGEAVRAGASATGRGIAAAGRATGRAVREGVAATGRGIAAFGRGTVQVIQAAPSAIASGAAAVGRGAVQAVRAAPGAIATGAKAAGRGAVAVGRGAFGAIGAALSMINSLLGPAVQTLQKILGPALNALGKALEPLAQAFASAFLPALTVAVAALTPAIVAFTPVMEKLGEILGPVLEVLATEFASVMEALAPIFMDLLETLAPVFQELGGFFGEVLKQIAPIIGDLLVALMPLVPIIADALLSALQVLTPIILQILEYITPLVPVIGEFLKAALEAVWPLFETLFEALSPLLPVLGDLLLAFIPLIEALLPIIEIVVMLIGLILALVAPILKLVAVIIGWLIEKALVPLIGWISKAVSWIADKLGPIFEWVKDKISWATDKITDKLGDLKKWWNDTWDSIGKKVSDIYDKYIAPIVGKIGDAWDSIKGLWSGDPTKGPEKKAEGGVIPGYAPGVDSVPALLSPGEGILRPEVVRRLGVHTINAWNRAAMAGRLSSIPRFATGGVVGQTKADPNAAITVLSGPALESPVPEVDKELTDLERVYKDTTKEIAADWSARSDEVSNKTKGALTSVTGTTKRSMSEVENTTRRSMTGVTDATRRSMAEVTKSTRSGLGDVHKTTVDRMSAFKKTISSTTDDVKNKWSSMISSMKKATKGLVNTSYSKGIVGIVSEMASLAGVRNPIKPVYLNTGGVLPGYEPGVDKIPAMLSPGEAVLRPEVVRALGEDTINAWNRAAIRGEIRRFATGGVVDGASWVRSNKNKPFKGYVDAFKAAFREVIEPILRNIGAGRYGSIGADDVRAGKPWAIKWLGQVDKAADSGGDAAKVIAVARKEHSIGVSGRRNRFNAFNGEAWCADFVSWVVDKARANKAYWNSPRGTPQNRWPAVRTWENVSARAGDYRFGVSGIRPGDIATYGGGGQHINIVEKVFPDGRFQTIGGNESNRIRRQIRSTARGYGRPRWNLIKVASGPFAGMNVTAWPGSGVHEAGTLGGGVDDEFYARGGIVRAPTRAVIGEAGPEAIIPLTDKQRTAEILQELGLPHKSFNFTVNAAPNVPTEETIRRQISYIETMYG
ncbi:tape measure domain-containing protein [Thermobifida phage P318]|nr:tape measure domain-containing protein [Thermobifida phage P318]